MQLKRNCILLLLETVARKGYLKYFLSRQFVIILANYILTLIYFHLLLHVCISLNSFQLLPYSRLALTTR